MADGQAAGLLGVILEVCLNILVGVVADNLGGVLGSADQTVGTDAPELDGSLGGIVGQLELTLLDGQVGHVVHDAHGEVVVAALGQVLEHGVHVSGGGVLGGQAITAADDADILHAGVVQHSGNVQIQRLAECTGLLGAVQNCDALDGLGQLREHVLGGEGTIQVNLQHADLGALGGHHVHDFLQGAADGTHSHDHVGGVGRTVVVEGLVVGADGLVDLVHVADHDVDQLVIGQVGSLAVLEEGFRGLVGAAVIGVVGQVGLGVELIHGIPVDHALQGLIVPGTQLLDLVGGTEAVEEVDEAHAALDGGQVGNRSQVHDLLGGTGGQHCHTGAAAGHHVLMVTEDGQGVGGQGTGCDVEHAGQALASDLIQVGDHQHQALRGGEGGGQGAGGQGAMDGTGSAGLRFHLHDVHAVAEDVSSILVGPFVHVLCHGGRGGDGVNSGYLSKSIGDVAGGGVRVHTLKGSGVFHFFHFAAPPFCAAMART